MKTKKLMFALTTSFLLLLSGCKPSVVVPPVPPVEGNDGSIEKPFTAQEAITKCDEAGSGVVVDAKEYYVAGTLSSTTYNAQYSQWTGKLDNTVFAIESATLLETMRVAPVDGKLDGKKVVVKGYIELYNETYKMGYLPASVSPTGKKYNPTIVAIEGSDSYEDMEGYANDGQKMLDIFTKGKTVSISVPALPDANDYEASITLMNGVDGYGFEAICTDTGKGNNAKEASYLTAVTAAGWHSYNDSEYTVEDYGYIFGDTAEVDNCNYEMVFYSYEGYFCFYLYDYAQQYRGKCIDSEFNEYDWYEPFLEQGYVYSETIPTEAIASYLEIDASKVITFNLTYGCVSAEFESDVMEYDDEEIYINSCYEVIMYGTPIESLYDDIEKAGMEYVESLFTEYYYSADHSYLIEYSYFSQSFSYINIKEFHTTTLISINDWSDSIKDTMASALNGKELPFFRMGDDYEILYDTYGKMVQISDTFYVDLSEDYGAVLIANDYTYVDYNEEDETGGYYIREFADGTIIKVVTFWMQGNYIVAMASNNATEVVLDKTTASLAPGATLQLTASFGPEGSLEPENDTITWATSDDKVATVSIDGLVTVDDAAAVNSTVTITAACEGLASATCVITVIEDSVVVGGWSKVTDASTLKSGDTIVLASEAQGCINGEKNGKYLDTTTATFKDSKITSDVPETSYITLGGEEGAWTLTNGTSKLAPKAAKNMFDGAEDKWTISIDAQGNAAIQSSNSSFGKILFNVTYPRFLNYASDVSSTMTLPQIYVLA